MIDLDINFPKKHYSLRIDSLSEPKVVTAWVWEFPDMELDAKVREVEADIRTLTGLDMTLEVAWASHHDVEFKVLSYRPLPSPEG